METGDKVSSFGESALDMVLADSLGGRCWDWRKRCCPQVVVDDRGKQKKVVRELGLRGIWHGLR